MEELTNIICLYYELSRQQRETELLRGLSLDGTKGYELQGCYACNGKNYQCNIYQEYITEMGDLL